MIVFISIGFSKNLVLQYRGNSREPTLNDEHNTEEIFQKASHYFSHQFCINLSLQKKKKVEMKKGYNSSLCVYYMYKVSTKGMTTGDYSYAHLQIP